MWLFVCRRAALGPFVLGRVKVGCGRQGVWGEIPLSSRGGVVGGGGWCVGLVLIKHLALPGVARGIRHLTFPPLPSRLMFCWVLCRTTRLGAACASLQFLKDMLTLRRCFATTALFLAPKMRQDPPSLFFFVVCPLPSTYPQTPPKKYEKTKNNQLFSTLPP